MKVKGQDPAFPVESPLEIYSGIPARIYIATKILAAIVGNEELRARAENECAPGYITQMALDYADELMEQHNAELDESRAAAISARRPS